MAQPFQQANFPGYENDPVAYFRDKLRINVTPDQVRITNALLEHGKVMVKSCHSSGKCKHQEDYVYLSNGKRVQARDLVGKTFQVYSLSPLGPVEVFAKAEWNKLEGTYQVITESGRQIIVNELHPLWTAIQTKNEEGFSLDVKGWTQLREIEVGDLVAVTKELPAFGERNIPREDIILLAHLITNFYKGFDRLSVIVKKDEQYEEIQKALSAKGARLSTYSQNGHFTIEYANIVENLIWGYGISPSFKDRKVPNPFFELDKEGTLLFLKTIFKDNVIAIKNDDEAKIKLYHRSEKFVRDLSYLLLKFGISTKVYKKDDKDFWVLRILNVEEFVEIFEREDLEYLIVDSPDERLDWRYDDAPAGTFWEKIKTIRWYGREWTVAIHVPRYEAYLTDFYEHNSYLAGALVNWNFDCFSESISLTTAPNEEVVRDVLWKEIRNHREKIPESMRYLAPKDMRMYSGPNHYAGGYVAANEAGARGRKSPHLMIIFDEADGIRPEFFDASEGMLIAENAKQLVLLNPIHMDSRAAAEEDNFHVIELSALEHPNVVAELKAGGHLPIELRPFPGIDMNLGWVNDKIRRMCRQIDASNVKANTSDFQWPPAWMYEDPRYENFLKEVGAKEPVFYRPKAGTEFEPRVLGKWMSNTDTALWTDGMWQLCSEQQPIDTHSPIQIGCDPAGQGKDSTVIVVARGRTALHMESHEAWDTNQILERLKQLATDYGNEAGMIPTQVPVIIDQTSNETLYDLRGGFNFIPVNASSKALEPDKYKNRRAELWYNTANIANEVQIGPSGIFTASIDVSRLIEENEIEAKELKRQLKAAEIRPLSMQKKDVEDKASMSKKLKRSPDHADAFNLAFSNYTQENSKKTYFATGSSAVIRRRLGGRYRK